MNTETFFENFGHLANAPDGVMQLRKMVLTLAVTGKLTKRMSADTCVESIFAQNQKHCRQLISENKIRKQKAVSTVDQKQLPWMLPHNWKWVRLGQVTSYGSTMKAEYADVESQTWVLELEDIEKTTSRLLSRVPASDRPFRSTKNRFIREDVLYGKLRPYLDKVLVADKPGVCTTEIIPIQCYEGVFPEYLRYYLKCPYFVGYANDSTHGMNLPRLGTEPARAALVALPPLEEQKRIVAKVDELMALCDKLEAQQQERARLAPILSRATHTRFTQSPTPENLLALFDGDACMSTNDMRKTILELAISLGLAGINRKPETGALGALLSSASLNGVSKGPVQDKDETEVLRTHVPHLFRAR